MDKLRELTKSLQSSLNRKFKFRGDKLNLSLFALYKITQEEANSDVEALLNSDEIQIRELGVKGIWDGRDNGSWPTRGYIALLETSWADLILGGDTKFFHWSTTFNHFLKLSDTFVFASSFSLESFSNVIRKKKGEDTDSDSIDLLPFSERIKSGGAESNRGFSKNELGPVVRYLDSDEQSQLLSIGGTQGVTFKFEVRQRLTNSFGMTYFVDTSNTYLTDKEFDLFSNRLQDIDPDAELSDNFAYDFAEILIDPSLIWTQNYISYGIALNYITPLGSVNASYAYLFRDVRSIRTALKKRKW